MVISSFYNEEENTLILATVLGAKQINSKQEKDIIKIYNERDELIGINIFNYNNMKLKQGIVNNEDIKEEINKFFGHNWQSPYLIGKIINIKKHPKSEKLNICQVDLGMQEVQIVCGASNVKVGIKVIVSQVGAVMPNGMKIKPSKLLDEESNGMITSLFELGLEKTAGQGIAILDDIYQIGQSYKI
ncbi:MAG: YtpR family tRNA-binding protein [Mycoplasmatales bacterium]